MQSGNPPPAASAASSRRGRRAIGVAAGVAVLLLLGVIVVNGMRSGAADDVRSHAGGRSASPSPAGEGTYDGLLATLAAHGQALVRGDEPGWLAPVDPSRTATYDYFKRLYATLRTMQVSSWTYARGGLPPIIATSITEPGKLAADLELDVAYCLITTPCPAFQRTQTVAPPPGPHPAHFRLRAAVEYRDGRWLIVNKQPSRVKTYSGSNLPWDDANLVFASSDRVTIGAPPGQTHHLDAVLAAANRAAALTHRYAHHLDAPRHRYLVFLAGDAEWDRWYGAERERASGYAISRGTVGMDVVLNMSAVRDPAWLSTVLRHEFGHVITLGGTGDSALAAQGADLFEEGIAEYIAYAPRAATANPRTAATRRQARRAGLPTSLDNIPPLPKTANADDAAAFYGLGHLVIGCLASRYGEPQMFRFIQLTQRQHKARQDASRTAFGRPWSEVERACLTHIRQTMRT